MPLSQPVSRDGPDFTRVDKAPSSTSSNYSAHIRKIRHANFQVLHNKVLIPDWFKILDKRDCSHLNHSIISASNIKNTSMILAQKFNLCIVAVPSQVPMSSELITLRIISTISSAMHLQNGNFIRTALTTWGILEGLGYYWVLVLNDSATSLELLPSYKVCLPGYS